MLNIFYMIGPNMLKITISAEAFQWLKQELHLHPGDHVRFFARYGGCSSVQSGFSLGMSKEVPNDIGAQETIEGITFYIQTEDLWYFDQHDLSVTYDPEQDEILYEYVMQD